LVPKGKLRKYEVSRLIIGGNPFSGFAHAGDLIYVGKLFQTYLTHEKIVETLALCEENGINTFIGRADDNVVEFLSKYEKAYGKPIQWIAQSGYEPAYDNFKLAIDSGAIGCFVQGGIADSMVNGGKVHLLCEYMSFIKEEGVLCGIGGHNPLAIRSAEEAGADADFYFLTINNVGYACEDPKLAGEVMSSIDKPFIGFKVLGAGRAKPEDGFKLAFESGADFIAVGMFDFQVKENVGIVNSVLSSVECNQTNLL